MKELTKEQQIKYDNMINAINCSVAFDLYAQTLIEILDELVESLLNGKED